MWNQSFIDAAELDNMLDAAEAVALAAAARERGLGAHVRLDGPRGGALAAFARPYSTVVRRGAGGALAVGRLARPRTPLRRLLPYLAQSARRKLWLKALRLLPPRAQDRIVGEALPRGHGRDRGAGGGRRRMKVTLMTARGGAAEPVVFDYAPREEGERPMALDVLLQARAGPLPDLAFRYGCRNRTCGVCTVDVNGRPRIACRARVREGDVIAAPGTLPVLRDLVPRRDGVARQLRGRAPGAARGNDLDVAAPDDYHALTACIECYACLHGCPMHARNFAGGAESRGPDGGLSLGQPVLAVEAAAHPAGPGGGGGRQGARGGGRLRPSASTPAATAPAASAAWA